MWKNNLGEAVHKTAIAHRGCISEVGGGSGRGEGPTAQRTRARHGTARHAAVHALLRQGASHGQIMTRLHLGRNTVKKYAAAMRPEQLSHGPKYRTTLVDPFREYLRGRRESEPDVPIWTLLQEIKAMGYQGGQTLLYRYLGQGRADDVHPPPSPRRLTSWIMTDPDQLTDTTRTRLEHTLKRCPELTAAAGHVHSFAALLTAAHDGDLDTHTSRLDE